MLLTATAGALGFALNQFSVEVYPGATFVFGGIFYLLIAAFYGPSQGFIAALMVSTSTLLSWGHAYSLPALALEGFVVALLVRRRKSLLMADLIYWGTVGIPLNILILLVFLKGPLPVGWARLIEQPINGLLVASIAEILFNLAFLQRFLSPSNQQKQRLPLRTHLEKGFVVVAALPLILLSIVFGRVYFDREKKEAAYRMRETANAVQLNIEDHIQTHLQAIIAMGSAIEQGGSFKTDDLNRWLERYHSIYGGFITMVVADREGRLIGAHPLQSGEGQPVLVAANTVADREYFKQPMATGKPFVSDVFLGRGFGQDPIVAISAPLHSSEGSVVGIVEGSLNLSSFREFGQGYLAGREAEIIILDAHQRVIHAPASTQYHTLQSLAGAPMMAAALKAGDGVISYDTGGFSREKDSGYLVARASVQSTGWTVLIRQPLSVAYKASHRHYLINMLSVLIGVFLSILVARWIGNRIKQPLEQLVEQVRSIDARGAQTRRIAAPKETPMEVTALLDDFDEMSVRLSESYGELQAAIEERDLFNHTLRKKEEKFSRVFLLSPDSIAITRLSDGAIKEVNEVFLTKTGYAREEVIGKKSTELNLWVNPDDRKAFFDSLTENGMVIEMESEVRTKDGQILSILVSGRTAEIGGELCAINISRDITRRKRAEEALRQAHEEMEMRVRERTSDLARINEALQDEIVERRRAEAALRSSEERFSKAFHANSNYSMITSFDDGRIVEVNETLLHDSGYTREEIIGRKGVELGLPANPADRDKVREILSIEGKVRDFESIWRTGKGEVRYSLISADIIELGSRKCILFNINDITNRRRAEEELREREITLRTLGDNLPDGVIYQYVLEPDGRHYFNYMSAGIEKLSGIRAEDALRDADLLFAQFLPEDIERIRRATVESMKKLTVFDVQARRRLPTGEVRWMQYRSKPRRLSNGATAWDGVEIDITERKLAEEARLLSEERFAKAFKSSPRSMSIISLKDWRFIDVNDGVLRMTDYEREEIIGRTPLELGLWADLKDRDLALQLLKEEGRIRELEIGFRTKSGNLRRGLFSAEVIEIEGEGCLLTATDDITERKQMEESLSKSEEQYRHLVNNASDIIYETDARGRLTLFNPTATKILGYEEEELRGRYYLDLIRHDYRDAIESFYRQQAADNVPVTYCELPVVAKDGSEIWIGQNVRFIQQNGSFAGAQAVARDITERKRVENELRESQERLMMALDAINAGAWEFDVLNRRLKWSGQQYKMYGVNPESFTVTPDALLDLMHPEDRDRFLQTVARAIKNEIEYDLEYRIIRPDESIRQIAVRGRVVRDAGGRAVRMIGIVQDITERRQEEEELQQAREAAKQARLQVVIANASKEWQHTFDAVETPLFILDFNGRIKRLNNAARDLAGKEFSEIIDLKIGQVAEGDPWRSAADIAREICRTAAPISCPAHNEASGRTWELTVNLFSRSDREENRIILVMHEVTNMVELERSLRRVEVMSTMGRLVAGVAHEVRNPLFGISATLDAFEDDLIQRGTFESGSILSPEMQEEYIEYLAALRQEVDRLNSLMKELLEYGKPTFLESSLFGIEQMISEAVEWCAPLAKSMSIIIDNHAAASERQVNADRNQLLKAFRNLIENAIQHSPAGGRVAIETEEILREETKWIVCRIMDNGPGFKPEDVPMLFEPFFTRRRGGTGLGLSLVRKIVEDHGGQVSLGNMPGGGAAATVEIPLV